MEIALQNRLPVNVSEPERWVSAIAGTALAAYGLKSRSVPSLIAAAIGGALLWRGVTGNCFVYQALDVTTAGDGDQVSVPYGKGIRVEKALTVNATPDMVYRFWRDFENLPRFMSHLKSVTVHDSKRSHWVARGPAGRDAEWDAEIINEIPGELIGWRSVEGSQVDNAGSVHFKPDAAGGMTRREVSSAPLSRSSSAKIRAVRFRRISSASSKSSRVEKSGERSADLHSRYFPFIASSARRAISSGATSSTCVAIIHVCPNGSFTLPERSP
jgi:uncharacterized membrane protein